VHGVWCKKERSKNALSSSFRSYSDVIEILAKSKFFEKPSDANHGFYGGSILIQTVLAWIRLIKSSGTECYLKWILHQLFWQQECLLTMAYETYLQMRWQLQSFECHSNWEGGTRLTNQNPRLTYRLNSIWHGILRLKMSLMDYKWKHTIIALFCYIN
jgi:hypothetical protein